MIEGLTNIEKLFLVNHFGYAIENEDPTALAMLVRNPKIIDLILNMQEEVKTLLEKPELITQGSRDPFARIYSGMHQEKRYSSNYYGNEDTNRSEDGQDDEHKHGTTIDPAILAKLTFKEIMELDKLIKQGMSSSSLVKRLEEGISQGNKKQLLDSLLRENDMENEIGHPSLNDLVDNDGGYGRAAVRQPTPDLQYRPDMQGQPYMMPQNPAYPYQHPQHPIAQSTYPGPQYMNYPPVGYPGGYYPPQMRMEGQTQGYPMQQGMPGMMLSGQQIPNMQMGHPYMPMYQMPAPPRQPPLMMQQPQHMAPPAPPQEPRSSFQKPPNPFITGSSADPK